MSAAEPARLTEEARALLRELALSAALAACRGERWDPPAIRLPEELVRPGGAFVSFKKGERLRGCMGRMVSEDPRWSVVAEMARVALREDPRFDPVGPEELPALTMEISLIGPLRPITGALEVVIGIDGLLVRKGSRSGVLLPQVAAECGWSPARFLDETCRKAGLPGDAWRKGADLFAFTAETA